MAHAQPEKKFMTRMPPRWGAVGAYRSSSTIQVADLTMFAGGVTGITDGDAYVYFQADGADLYILTAPSVGQAQQINPGTAGSPGALGTHGGSVPATQGPLGICGLLLSDLPPEPYILEPGVDLYLGFVTVNPNATGWLRYWRASMSSNG